jgi:hypothetical protein
MLVRKTSNLKNLEGIPGFRDFMARSLGCQWPMGTYR